MAFIRRENLNLANALTLLRVLLIPVFCLLKIAGRNTAALAVFLLAGVTDILDGYAARKLKVVTDFGKLLDPLADKLMVLSALLLFVVRGVFPLSALLILFGKELLVVVGGLLLYRRKQVVSSRHIGKAAQCVLFISLSLGFFHDRLCAAGLPIHRVLLWVAVGLSLAALFFYGYTNVLRHGADPPQPPADKAP